MKVYSSASEIPPGHMLGDCAVSGGTLRTFIQEALVLSGGRLCLRLVPRALAFPLPARNEQGSPVSPELLTQLRASYPSHYAPALKINYLIFEKNSQLHILLYDTEHTIAEKKALAQELGVPCLLLSSK